jgi:hypothetical protein
VKANRRFDPRPQPPRLVSCLSFFPIITSHYVLLPFSCTRASPRLALQEIGLRSSQATSTPQSRASANPMAEAALKCSEWRIWRFFSEFSPICTGFLPTTGMQGIGEVQAHDNASYRYLHLLGNSRVIEHKHLIIPMSRSTPESTRLCGAFNLMLPARIWSLKHACRTTAKHSSCVRQVSAYIRYRSYG